MTRLFMGWKSGVGGVMKIMANNTDDPLTTPNTDYSAFRFNSETAAIGYGDFKYSFTFTPASYDYSGAAVHYYSPNATTPKTKATSSDHAAGERYVGYVYPNNIFADKNAFHFVFVEQTTFRSLWTLYRRDPPSSDDTYNVTGRPAVYNQDLNITPLGAMIAPRKVSSAWSLVSITEGFDLVSQSDHHSVVYAQGPVGTNLPAYTIVCYQLDLPVDSSAYPAVSPGAPVSGQKILSISPAAAKMSKTGYSVDSATEDQLIFDSNKLPMKVIKTGLVTVNAGATVNVALGASYAQSIFVDYLVNKVGAGLWVPPWPDETASELDIRYRISGTNLQLYNPGAVNCQVRYLVMAADDLGNSSGTAKVFENVAGSHVMLRRPGSAGTRLRDTILDSRLSYLPIVAEDWVPFSSFTASDQAAISTHMYMVNLSNPGGTWKPYVLAKVARGLKTNLADVVYREPWAKHMENANYFADSTFMIRITDTQVKFYASNGSRFEDAYTTPTLVGRNADRQAVGLRYYIFAIPNTL